MILLRKLLYSSFLSTVTLLVAVICTFSVQAIPVKQSQSRSRRELLNNEEGPLSHQLYFHEIKPASHMETFSKESVTLTCQAGGSPPPTIHWLKNGLPLSQSSFENSELMLEELAGVALDQDPASNNAESIGLSSTRSRLFLDCLQPKDSAIYTCVAETPFSRISTDTKLVVTDSPDKLNGNECIEKRSGSGFGKPARITMWTDTRMELTGADVRLFCRASGSPTPQVTWERADDGPITNDPRHKILPSGDLIIKKVSFEDDMGRFICIAQNSLGRDKAKMFLYPTAGDTLTSPSRYKKQRLDLRVYPHCCYSTYAKTGLNPGPCVILVPSPHKSQ